MEKCAGIVIAGLCCIWFSMISPSHLYAQSEDDGLFSDEETTNQRKDDTFNEDAVVSPDEGEGLFTPDEKERPKEKESKKDAKRTGQVSKDGLEIGEQNRPVTGETRVSNVQNAVLEGIQLSKEAGATPDESIVTGYFIFRDKPTSYFYEAKVKQKTIVFEFNDVVRGVSPIPSAKEPPIQGFRIEDMKVDANKEVVGLKPEWHDILKVSFFFDAIPQITVKDEYSVISFSFRWSTDAAKQKDIVVEEGGKKGLIFGLIGGGVVAGGVGAWILLKEDNTNTKEDPLSAIHDEIVHPIPK